MREDARDARSQVERVAAKEVEEVSGLDRERVAGMFDEDRVEIGANSCVDRGALGDTVVGEGTKIEMRVPLDGRRP